MLKSPLPNLSTEIHNDKNLIWLLGELFEVSNAMCVYGQKTRASKAIRDQLDAIQTAILFARRDVRIAAGIE
jgi:hypothetical protein